MTKRLINGSIVCYFDESHWSGSTGNIDADPAGHSHRPLLHTHTCAHSVTGVQSQSHGDNRGNNSPGWFW